MRHPFENLQKSKRRLFFFYLLFATVLLMLALNYVGAPLITTAAPFGIISFELAGTVSNSQAIIDSWDHNAQLHAAFSLGLDYLFMLLYSTTISLACVWSGQVLANAGWPLSSAGIPLAWGQWLAAVLDGVENIALVIILFGSVVSPWPELAKWSAVFKFGLIFLGLVYAFYGLVAQLTRRFV